MASKAWRRARRDTWILRAAAFVISILLWIVVLGGEKNEVKKLVQIDYILPRNLVISNQAPAEVAFRLSGPSAFLKEIEERRMSIPVDLTRENVGDYELRIRDEMLSLPLGVRVVSVSQSLIPLKLDRVQPKRVPIRAVFAGQLPDGIKISRVTLNPSTVEVRGAVSRVSGIDAIPTEPITPTANSLRQDFDVKLSLQDMPGISIEDQYRIVHVTAELEGKVDQHRFSGVPIALKVGSGRTAKFVPTDGLGIRIRPSTVTFVVQGPSHVMQNLKNTDIEVWAEIPSLKDGVYKSRLAWRLAPELRVVNRSRDVVEIVVPPNLK